MDRPVCDGVPAQPQPDPGRGGEPHRFWRVAAWVLFAGLTALVVWTVVTYEPPDRSRCTHLIAQSQYTPDVAAELEAAGCVEPAASPGHDLTARP